MDYFNRSNDEELGGISNSTLTSNITSDKISSISLDNREITIDTYDTAISDLSEKLENLTKKVTGDYCIIKNLFKQEKRSNKISEWREFDLEAATGREFETR